MIKRDDFVPSKCPICGYNLLKAFTPQNSIIIFTVLPSLKPYYDKTVISVICPRHHGPVDIILDVK